MVLSNENTLSGVEDDVFGSWQESWDFFLYKQGQTCKNTYNETKNYGQNLIFVIFKNPKYGSKWLPLPWSVA